MTNPKKSNKIKLDSATAKVSPPWEAWHHVDKQMTFYVNTITKKSVWEHPDTLKNRKDAAGSSARSVSGKSSSSGARKRQNEQKIEDSRMDWEPSVGPSEVKEAELPKKKKTETDVSKPNVIHPDVEWRSAVRPYPIIQYQGCAIFDTCSIFNEASILEQAAARGILCVIPLTVIYELDGLKKSGSKFEAQEVNNQFLKLLEEKSPYIRFEDSRERAAEIGEYQPTAEFVADDWIFRTALRTKMEIVSVSQQLKIRPADIRFVTDDRNLTLKANIERHDLNVLDVAAFSKIIRSYPVVKAVAVGSSRTARSDETLKGMITRIHKLRPEALEIRGAKNWFKEVAKDQRRRESLREKPTGEPMEQERNNAPKFRPAIPLADDDDDDVLQLPAKSQLFNNSFSTLKIDNQQLLSQEELMET